MKHSKAGLQTLSHPQNSTSHLLGLQGLPRTPAQIRKDLGKTKKLFSVRLAAVYSTVNRRCRLFACFFVSDLLLFTACKHAALV